MSSTAQEDSGGRQLQAILPDWCALTWQHALICFTFLILFLHLCYLPLPTGQIWHEVANGRTIVNSGIAGVDPAVAYSEGVRALTTSWLGQAFVYWTYQIGGSEWLSCMFALVQLATLAIWAVVFQQVSGRRWTAMLAAPILLAGSVDVNAFGSSILGLFVFALIALAMAKTFSTKNDPTKASDFAWSGASLWQWLIVVSLFVVWSNLDISVLIGVGLLGMLAIGRLVGVLTQREGHAPLLQDRELHHRTWLFELCLVATLLQPAGLEMWQAMFWSSNNPIVHALGGWSPVVVASWRGFWIAAAWLGWIAASRKTTSVPPCNGACAIFVTLIVACFQSQIIWFAITMCFLCVALLPKPTKRFSTQTKELFPQGDANPSLKFSFTLVCGLIIWVGFSLSPIGTMVLAGKRRPPEQLYSSNTPLGATKFLKENRPEKTVWTPKYWADHLQVQGAPTQIMANLNDALLTPRVEKDYQSIYYGGKNWQRLLRRYQIDDLVVDRKNQTELIRELRNNSGPMEKVFEDQISIIYRRVTRRADSMQPSAVVDSSETKSKTVAFETAKSTQPQPTMPKEEFNREVFNQEEPETNPSELEPAAARLFDDRSNSSKSIFED